MTKFAIILNQRVLDYICNSLAHAKCLVKIFLGATFLPVNRFSICLKHSVGIFMAKF